MKPENRTCSHELFKWCAKGANSFVFLFERSRYIPLSPEGLAEYRRRLAIVRANGGHMILEEYQAGGQNQVLTESDVKEMITAVQRDNPDLTVVTHWNGAGCYTLSVGCEYLGE